MELFLIYLWLKLDMFLVVLVSLACLFFAIRGGFAIAWSDQYGESEKEKFEKKWASKRKKFIPLAILCATLAIIIPSAKETAILVGASYAIDLAKSPEGIKVQSLIRKKANEFLDEQLKEKEAK